MFTHHRFDNKSSLLLNNRAREFSLEGRVITLSRTTELELRLWLSLAISSLAIAGILALAAVVARVPWIHDCLLRWSWHDLFPKIVVVHVSFSFVIWYLCILCALTVLATERVIDGKKLRKIGFGSVSLVLTGMGVTLLISSILLNLGEASLNNYIPVLMHPLFHFGLITVATGVAMVILRLLINLPGRLCLLSTFEYGIVAIGFTFLVALACFASAWATLPADIKPEIAMANERLFWGGGHILQFVNSMLMLLSWRILAERVTGVVLPSRLFISAIVLLLTTAALSLLFYKAADLISYEHREAFTQLFWYGLPPPVIAVTLEIAIHLARFRHKLTWYAAETPSLLLSLLLCVVGGILGYFLGVGDTRTPSHYHAVIGAVNLSVMGLFFSLLLPLLKLKLPVLKIIHWQVLLYGIGQLLFSIGMFAAGVVGVPRKTAGLEQGIDTLGKYVYITIYGLGGVLSIIGGSIFVLTVLTCLLSKQEKVKV